MGMLGGRRAQGILVGSVIAAGLLITLIAFVFLSRPSLESARKAYDQGDWTTAGAIASKLIAEDPRNHVAQRIRARSLGRLGEFREALELESTLGGAGLEAEDLFVVGQGLIQHNQPELGWVALDAAARVGPNHKATIEALAARPRSAPGVPGVDRLSATPDSATLADLVVGLALVDEGSRKSVLERVLSRDRATFRKLDRPAAARNLLARALLEDGRPLDARTWLERTSSGTEGDHREAQWLLSRVLLLEGENQAAKQALAKAGDFGHADPIAREPGRYVGAARCVECHSDIAATQQSSHHSATLALGEGLAKTPLPNGPIADPGNPDVTHAFAREGSKVRLTSRVEGREFAGVIDYAVGSGHHGVTMLSRDPGGRHRSLRMSYYSGGRHWGLTSGFEPRPSKPEAYVGEPLNDESFRNCLNCHSTRFTSEADRTGPEASDRGIGCERCHGPGENHIRAIEAKFPDPAIARPRLATPSARLKLCAQCHASDGVIPPADPRFIRFVATTLPYSRCVSESGGRLDCVACHDPHRDVETSAASYDARCLACHGGAKFTPKPDPEVHLEPFPAAPCPVNPAQGCVGCHMPKVDNIMPFMSFTDHHIRVHRPLEASPPARVGP